MRLLQAALFLSVSHAAAFTVIPEVSLTQTRIPSSTTTSTLFVSSSSDVFTSYGTVSVAPDSKYPGGSPPLYPVMPHARATTTTATPEGSWWGAEEVQEMREMRVAPPPMHDISTDMIPMETLPMHAETSNPMPAVATTTPPVPTAHLPDFMEPVQADPVVPVAQETIPKADLPRGLAYSKAYLPKKRATTSALIEKSLPIVVAEEELEMDETLSRGLAYSKARSALLEKKRVSVLRGLTYSKARLAMIKENLALDSVEDSKEEVPLETEDEEEAIPSPRGLSYSKFRSSLAKNGSNTRHDKDAVSYEPMGSLIGA